jgi:hypothetical protein
MNDFYIILSSNNSLEYFPKNASNQFTTVLPHEINLNCRYKFALLDILLPPCDSESTAVVNYINCSICSPIITSNSYSNVIRTVAANKTKKVASSSFSHPFYLPLAKLNFNTIEISITDHLGKLVKFIPSNTVLTLHFKEF